jgi:hypothetical protein
MGNIFVKRSPVPHYIFLPSSNPINARRMRMRDLPFWFSGQWNKYRISASLGVPYFREFIASVRFCDNSAFG